MKKIFVSLLTLLLAFVFVGCGGNNPIKITFESNGGTEVVAIEAKAGETITQPADPTLIDMTFGGWYSDIDLLEKYEFPQTMPEKSITLYAKWVVTLKFDTQGAGAVADIVGEGGSVFTIPEAPVREGYVFVGWYLDKTYETRLTYVMPKKNSVVYARWQVYETGSAITLSDNWVDNDDAYIIEKTNVGTKLTATSGKGEWSYAYLLINCNAKKNTTIVVEFKGTKDCNVTFKVEGGGAETAAEHTVVMTGENQKLEWSVDSTNLTEVGGQMFLVFLNGGVSGASEVPQYIEIKSISLYRTLEATDEQKSAIYFISNNGTNVETIYQKAGTDVTAPIDPTRVGYVFDGWYTESTLENKYVFDKMPEKGAMLYAKWIAAEVKLTDVDLMGGEWNILDAGTYEVNSTANLLTIKKTATGAEWNCITLPMTGKELGGYNLLRVTIKGTKGAQMLFKINDAVEKWVTCTGLVQNIELPFDVTLDPNKSLVVFANAGIAGASDVFEITKLAYGNYSKYMDLLGKNWTQNEDGLHKVDSQPDVLTISKDNTDGTEWHAILLNLSDVKLIGYNGLKVKVQGTAGEKIMFKVNDQGAGEKSIDCTGEVQEIIIPFELDFDMSKAALVVFANPGTKGTGNKFVITELAFICDEEESDPLIKTGNIDLSNFDWTPLDAGTYTITKQIVINKATTGAEWQCVAVNLVKPNYIGVNKLVVELKGTAGEEIMFKINDTVEKKIVMTGEVQTVEFDVNHNFDEKKAAMIIFVNPGIVGTGHDVIITKLALTGENVNNDLINGTWKSLDEGSYVISKEVLFKKNAIGAEWNCVVIKTEGYDFTGIKKLAVEIKGTAGEEIMFKINDTVEKKVLCTGEIQTVEFDFDIEFDASKATMIIFGNPGIFGTEHNFVITNLKLIRDEVVIVETKDVNYLEGTWNPLDQGTYVVKKVVSIHKETTGTEWQCASISLNNPDYTGINKLVVAVKGPAGEEIMFKINDTVEKKVLCTGEVQNLEFDFTQEFNTNKVAMIIFVNPGVAGTGHDFIISNLSLTGENKEINLLDGTFKSLDDGIYAFSKSVILNKTTTGTEWQCVSVQIPNVNYEGLKKLVVKIKGTAGEKIMFKVNDQGVGEKQIECNGEVQELSFDLDMTFDASKPALIVFANPGSVGTGHDFIIYSAILTK